jgi:hypothetical protein
LDQHRSRIPSKYRIFPQVYSRVSAKVSWHSIPVLGSQSPHAFELVRDGLKWTFVWFYKGQNYCSILKEGSSNKWHIPFHAWIPWVYFGVPVLTKHLQKNGSGTFLEFVFWRLPPQHLRGEVNYRPPCSLNVTC